MEPVDPVDDFLTTRGTVRKLTLSVYDPVRDAVVPSPDPIRGSRGERAVTQGDVPITTCTWFITAATPDQQLRMPTLKSHLVCAGETWRIESIGPNPRSGRLFECRCTLVVP